MDTATRTVMLEASRHSDLGDQSFGQIVKELMAAGVERYHQDFVRAERVYYMPNGETEVVQHHLLATTPPDTFSEPDVIAPLRAVQAGTIKYIEFCEQIAAAGCVGYMVSIAGKRVTYYGRTGDSYTEWFPGAKPN
ncbi:MAG TPA: DUF1398 family protein [Magnetospirillaceae bacterium]|jgi:uncharacterized protein YbcV (DUF1398 family)